MAVLQRSIRLGEERVPNFAAELQRSSRVSLGQLPRFLLNSFVLFLETIILLLVSRLVIEL